MSAELPISRSLALPIDAATQRLAFLGKPGSGKSYAATKLAELLHDAGAQFIALDPVGIWYGLRLDGRGKGLPVPVFGGLHGDVPLTPTSGAMIADLVVDRRLSCVLDTSQFEHDTDKARFAAGFASRFFFRMKAAPAAVHLFLEECQEYVPQNPQRGEEQMLHDFTRIDKLGRNFGIGVSLITQRPQEVNKKVLNLTECLFAFQMTGAHERKAIKEWVHSVGADENILTLLPSLAVAHAHVYSPQWLRISETVKIGEKRTADVSSTPAVGVSKVAEKPLTPVDLGKIREAMAETIEKAKADDPKELRREIAALKKQVGAASAKTIEKPVVDERAVARAVAAAQREQVEAIKKLRRALEAAMKFIINVSAANFDVAGVDKAELERAVAAAIEKASGMIDQRLTARAKKIDDLRLGAQRIAAQLKAVLDDEEVLIDVTVEKNAPFTVTDKPARPTRRSPSPRAPSSEGGASTLSGARLKIARALAELDAIGVVEVKRAQLAFYTGLTFSGGYGSNTLGAMRTDGIIDYPTGGYVALTPNGRAAVGEIDPPTSLDDLHARVRRHLTGLSERIFDVVVALGADGSITRDALGVQIGATFSGGYGSNTLGALRTAGIVEYPTNGSVGPSDLLFPEGLD